MLGLVRLKAIQKKIMMEKQHQSLLHLPITISKKTPSAIWTPRKHSEWTTTTIITITMKPLWKLGNSQSNQLAWIKEMLKCLDLKVRSFSNSSTCLRIWSILVLSLPNHQQESLNPRNLWIRHYRQSHVDFPQCLQIGLYFQFWNGCVLIEIVLK